MKQRWNLLKNKIRQKVKAVLPQRAWQIISWRPGNKWLRLIYKFARLSLYAFLFFLFADLCFPLKTKIEYAPVVRAKGEVPLYTFLTQDQQWRFYTELDEISPDLSKAIIYKEDRFFYYHPGVNLLAIGRAVANNILQRKRTSGASTISMQVARLLEPKQRSFTNKFVEIFRALQLELHYSKKEILQLYLNLVPYGSNIQGVKAASLLYFNKSPDQLSLAELTALSIIPNRPNSMVIGKDNALITAARNKWLRRFGKAGLFPPGVIEDALEEPLTATRNAAPRLAPQFALRMKTIQPGVLELNTSIDANIQYKAEELTAHYSKALKLQNIHNAAVIVIDNKSREVLAYIGSPDFSDFSHQGQVDGVKAVRSPGSTLKPLLYGLAFDLGIATPKTVITDIPVNYKGYAPENYDMDYRGNVSIEEALRQSLNIPSVKVLNTMGVQNFVGKLYDAGFQSVWKDRNKNGALHDTGRLRRKAGRAGGALCRFCQRGAVCSAALDKKRSGCTSRFIDPDLVAGSGLYGH
jgi:Membrane carboxypeptidase/penicillin-binding protein PbpC